MLIRSDVKDNLNLARFLRSLSDLKICRNSRVKCQMLGGGEEFVSVGAYYQNRNRFGLHRLVNNIYIKHFVC